MNEENRDAILKVLNKSPGPVTIGELCHILEYLTGDVYELDSSIKKLEGKKE